MVVVLVLAVGLQNHHLVVGNVKVVSFTTFGPTKGSVLIGRMVHHRHHGFLVIDLAMRVIFFARIALGSTCIAVGCVLLFDFYFSFDV